MPSPVDDKLFYLFISIIIGLIPTVVIILINNRKKLPTKPSFFLYTGWFTAAVFAVYLSILLYSGQNPKATALAPLGILLSALIASASVMKNIESQRYHEHKKEKRELYEDRIKVYEITAAFLVKIIQYRKVEWSETLAFYQSTSRADFIYPDHIRELIDLIYAHSIDLAHREKMIEQTHEALKALNDNTIIVTMSDDEEFFTEKVSKLFEEKEEKKPAREKELRSEQLHWMNESKETFKWINATHTKLRDTFMPYLKIQ